MDGTYSCENDHFFCVDPDSECIDPIASAYPSCGEDLDYIIGDGSCNLANNIEVGIQPTNLSSILWPAIGLGGIDGANAGPYIKVETNKPNIWNIHFQFIKSWKYKEIEK